MENYFHENHAAKTCITAYYLASFSCRDYKSFKNIGMRSMQEFIFSLGGCDGTVCVLNDFTFVTDFHDFQKTKISRKDRKNLIYLNSHRYYVIYCLYCLNTSKLN